MVKNGEHGMQFLGVFGQFVNIRLYSRCYGPSLVNPDINARTEC